MNSSYNKTVGFTLIEVLVALVVLALGMLGIARYTADALSATQDNNARTAAISAATQAIAPLYQAASGNNPANFQTQLNALGAGITVTSNRNNDNYNIVAIAAQDDNGDNVLTGTKTPTDWISPIRVGVRITYTGTSGVSAIVLPYAFYLVGGA